MNNFQCDIIVLTWNHLELTKIFFESLLSSTSLKIRIIAVDNGSIDGTREYLGKLKEKLTDKLEVIFNQENTGFVRVLTRDCPFLPLLMCVLLTAT
ncbi:MAG: glycosyltransferase [Candidatus Omnitrophica bacterium]|nr:glycosyltransferase [Candidatus Omnitrophota bacterium]